MEVTHVKSTPGARYHINYHLVWCPKYRCPVLVGKIQERLQGLLGEIAERWGIEVVAQEVMPDHIHLFVSAPPKFSPAQLAQLFKGTTSRVLRQEFPTEIDRHIWKVGTLWAPSYDVGTAGHVSASVIKRYILECQKL
ncbi:IS200/IS605 family transposase [Chloroflexia bacterium SDU3-3]|nr:IS200/IS605 family transposase [Chloroflexia bacterium SDU3-3]